jgi:ribosome-binding protein aMBF1 (putative translation factor)
MSDTARIEALEARIEQLEAETAQLRGAAFSFERAIARHKEIPLRHPENADLAEIVARVQRDGESEMSPAALAVIAPAIKRAREACGLPFEVVATRSGIDPATMAHIEAGEPGPNWDSVRRVAFMLGLNLNEPFVRPVPKQVIGRVA